MSSSNLKGTTPRSVGTTPRSLAPPPAPAPEVPPLATGLLQSSESKDDSARSLPSSSMSGSRSGESSPRSGNSSAENTPRGGKKHTHRRLSSAENFTHDGIDYHGAETPKEPPRPKLRRFSQSNVSEDDVDDEQLTSKIPDAEDWGVQIENFFMMGPPALPVVGNWEKSAKKFADDIVTKVSEVFKPKDEDGAKEGGAENEGPAKGRRLPPALDAKLNFRARFKDESDAQEEEQAYKAQNEAVETTAEGLGQAATWAIDAVSKVQAEKDKHQQLIIDKAKEVVQESASVYNSTTNKGHGIIGGAATNLVGNHTQGVLKMEKFVEAENTIMLGPPGLPIGAH